MAAKLLNLLAATSLAILACSFGAEPTNALSIDSHNLVGRSPIRAHSALAKKRRGTNGKRCKPRPSSSSVVKPAPATTLAPKPTTTPAPNPTAVTSSKAPAPTTTKASGGGGDGTPNNGGGNSGSNGGSGKVGLAWPIDDNKALANFKTNKVSPIYSWGPWISSAAKGLGFEPVPMLWGEKQTSEFKRIVVKGYAKTVLGFNEPNQQGQSDMSPQRAAELWQQYIQPLKSQGYSLISPGCTNAPSGKTWLRDFFKACQGCTFDGLAIHFYGTDPQSMISYLKEMHDAFGLPIWATEFACQNFSGSGKQCGKDDVFNWMNTLKNFMDNTSWVAHYFAFGAMYDMGNVNPLNQLLGSNGKPTDLGYLYIN
ncbi:Alkali-sensitive linkage protein 1 [Hypsizygus marmoreus]|uniref:Alkali-sensitive linkage protein 1 n=1 Tax=Hypsizygus marmoreus TaxID=39966 RepID=A0A369JQE3_HYPMA|nr:Alkali-sensitive linkage protein 1 [Hypsizygus marmoreus]